MKIALLDLIYLENTYLRLVYKMPEELREVMPKFTDFMGNPSWKATDNNHVLDVPLHGEQNLKMLYSPHAATLLRVWAIRRLPGQ